MSDQHLDYRVGITHLRAISVVLVVLFHAGVIDSGYLGVDVFFVLSGYLISSILWRGLGSERPVRSTLVDFYVRRAKRILPLSLLVLMLTAVAARLWFDTLIDDWSTAARAAVIWSENWFLIGQANDYFASEGSNPFQHYWSLGVEEQFYLVLPLLLAGLLVLLRNRTDQVRLVVLAVASAAGIAAAFSTFWLFDMTTSEFYYSSFSRSYQLLAGVAAMAVATRWKLDDTRRWPVVVAVAGLVALSTVAGLSVIWSGFWATICAVACVLSSRAVLVRSVWLERIGLWSYGIYLWHFPISLYMTEERLDTDPWVAFAVTMVASTALAAASYHLFENPIRKTRFSPAPTFSTTAATLGIAWVALGLLSTSAPPPVYADAGPADERAALVVSSDGTVEMGNLSVDGRLAAADVERLEGWMPTKETSLATCGQPDYGAACIDLEADPGRPTVMLIGDSYANRIYQALRPLAEEQRWGLAAFGRPGCPWMKDVFNDVGDDSADACKHEQAKFVEAIASVEPDVVVIHNYPYRDANRKMSHLRTGERATPDEVADAAMAALDEIEATGARVVFVEPTPFEADGANVDACLKVATWADECDFDVIDVDSPMNRAIRARAETDPMLVFTSINDLICEDLRCRATFGRLAVMSDSTHVSGGLWVKVRNRLLSPIDEAIAAGG